jgi:hypothetical protein
VRTLNERLDVNLLLNRAQAVQVQRLNQLVLAKTGSVPSGFNEKLALSDADKRVLTFTYFDQLNGYFTTADIEALNKLYEGGTGQKLREDEQRAVLAMLDAEETLIKRKMAKVMSRLFAEYGAGRLKANKPEERK